METLLLELTIIVAVASFLSLLMKRLSLPTMLSYILVGTLLGPIAFGKITSHKILNFFGELGIAFLLFITGLHLKIENFFKEEKDIVSLGTLQIILTTIFFLPIFYLITHDLFSSLLLSVFTSFSSTIVATKLLTDNNEIRSLFGKITLGVLIVQDITAALCIFLISMKNFNIIGLLGIITLLILVNLRHFQKLLSEFIYKMAKYPDTLFLFSIAWVLCFGLLFHQSGLSLELGSLIAGMILANTEYKEEIESRLKPLREFFILFFFVYLGLNITYIPNLIDFFSLLSIAIFLIFIKIFTVYFLLNRVFNYSFKTSKYTALYLSSSSEFGFVCAFIAKSNGLLTVDLSFYYILLVLTIFISTYIIQSKKGLYKIIKKYLIKIEKILEDAEKELSHFEKEKSYEYLLLGCDRVGMKILWELQELGKEKNLLVIDFNPDVIKRLKREGINCVCGDVSDIYFLETLNLKDTKVVISTVPSIQDNIFIVKYFKSKNKEIKVINVAQDMKEAIKLYTIGSDYVILPYFLIGEFITNILKNIDSKEFLEKVKSQQLKELIKRYTNRQHYPKHF